MYPMSQSYAKAHIEDLLREADRRRLVASVRRSPGRRSSRRSTRRRTLTHQTAH